jgi:hypothetical protein
MGTFTPNYNLYKPDDTDLVNEDTDLNANWDIVDSQLDGLSDTNTTQNATLADHESRLDVLETVGFTVGDYELTLTKINDQVIATSSVETVEYDSAPVVGAVIGAEFSLVPPIAGSFTWTADLEGFWSIILTAQWEVSPSADDVRLIKIVKNGEIVAIGHAPQTTGVNDHACQCSCTWTGIIRDGDTIELQVWQNSGGNLDLIGVAAATDAASTKARFLRHVGVE